MNQAGERKDFRLSLVICIGSCSKRINTAVSFLFLFFSFSWQAKCSPRNMMNKQASVSSLRACYATNVHLFGLGGEIVICNDQNKNRWWNEEDKDEKKRELFTWCRLVSQLIHQDRGRFVRLSMLTGCCSIHFFWQAWGLLVTSTWGTLTWTLLCVNGSHGDNLLGAKCD